MASTIDGRTDGQAFAGIVADHAYETVMNLVAAGADGDSEEELR